MILPEIKPAINPSVGIDLGLIFFAVLSSNEKVKSPDYSQLDRKIRRTTRKFSRTIKGSKRRELLRIRVAKLKAKQRDIRKDFLHKLSTKVVIENQVIALEDLNFYSLFSPQPDTLTSLQMINQHMYACRVLRL